MYKKKIHLANGIQATALAMKNDSFKWLDRAIENFDDQVTINEIRTALKLPIFTAEIIEPDFTTRSSKVFISTPDQEASEIVITLTPETILCEGLNDAIFIDGLMSEILLPDEHVYSAISRWIDRVVGFHQGEFELLVTIDDDRYKSISEQLTPVRRMMAND